jgi:hypothetical protein
LKDKATELLQSYYDGKITPEQFEKDYTTLENYANSHGWRKLISGGIISLKDAKNQAKNNKLVNLGKQFDALGDELKGGKITAEDYQTKIAELRDEAQKWGASVKEIAALDKNSEKAIKKANKKK